MKRHKNRHPYLRITRRHDDGKSRASSADKEGFASDDVGGKQNNRARQKPIDAQGYRKNVGIVVANGNGEVLWARRIKRDGWQFPQGGIEPQESVMQAAYRELYEEIGLEPAHVEYLGKTSGWLRYDLPYRINPKAVNGRTNVEKRPPIRGQKQVWVLFRLTSSDTKVQLNASQKPEFDAWRWVDYWRPVDEIISFKRGVYKKALQQLRPLIDRSKASSNPTNGATGDSASVKS